LCLAIVLPGLGCSSDPTQDQVASVACHADSSSVGDTCVPGAAAPTGTDPGVGESPTTPATTPTSMTPAGGGATGGTVPPAAGMGAPFTDAGVPPTVEPPPPEGSTGCGATEFPASGTQMLDVAGTAREFIVEIPTAYDSNKPYKLVFAWHGLGGTAMQIASGYGGGFYGLESKSAGSSIFIAAQGLATSNAVGSGPGWDNMGGRDVAFTKAMLDWVRAKYCIDNKRIFSVGMSYGGIMSNTVGCSLGEDFRAIAPMAGAGPATFGPAKCVGQVAAWLAHGNMDMTVPFTSGQMSRDYWVGANHCQSTSKPIGTDGCLAYDGCDAGYPVTFCEFTGGHTVPPFASASIWEFFSQF
jgi:poly(3-hydroxybutyrate) depolymerase